MNRWWAEQPQERYWLEITDRADLGVDLKAPQTSDNGQEYWSYSMVWEVRDGDVVFHYHKPAAAIVGCSRVVGGPWSEPIVWGAHGTAARGAGITPYARPGWRVGLDGFTELARPVTLDAIRRAEPVLRKIVDELASTHGHSVYFPIALSDHRPPRPAQGYLAKLPLAFVASFDALSSAAAVQLSTSPSQQAAVTSARSFGANYRSADEGAATSERDPFTIDPSIVDRGVRGHASTQNWLASEVRAKGMEPRSPGAGDANFDLAWQAPDGAIYVAEVKSSTAANQERQLRLGLGQVLRYRQLLAEGGANARGVLAIEEPPIDPRWIELCAGVCIALVWPGAFRL